jgi:(p)ppGpp synthase/HD superfamily hydrolase
LNAGYFQPSTYAGNLFVSVVSLLNRVSSFLKMIRMKPILEKIKDFAEKAQKSRSRKQTPKPHIFNPVRVMNLCSAYIWQREILAAALLHEVLEDKQVGERELLAFLESVMQPAEARRTVSLVRELTDEFTESSYPQWNRKRRKEMEAQRLAIASSAAQTIKYADIFDNCERIVGSDPSFAPQYLTECLDLLSMAKNGNPELYQLTMDLVSSEFKKVVKSWSVPMVWHSKTFIMPGMSY